MNNVGQKFLPIGTVVMLKGASKRVMISGFCSMAAEDPNVMYDYAGCMYPEGFLSSDQTALFNHDQIEKIYHMGLVDQEENEFKIKLNQLLSANNAVATSAQQVVSEQSGVIPVAPQTPVVPEQPTVVEQPMPPIGPGLPGYVAPVEPVAPQTPVVPEQPAVVEQPVPPIGPGLPGYVAPVEPVAAQTPVVPSQPAPANVNGFQFDAQGNVISAPQAPEQPTQQTQPLANIQFDENGTVVSA